jgi:transposase InsO family protein
MALQDRQPPQGLLHHSDRGSQYASYDYQELLAAHGLLSSMSRKGNCWDNAVAESFFATLKLELGYQRHWHTRTQARSEIFEYIELSTIASGGIRPSATCLPMNSNLDIINQWLPNPSVHAFGATSTSFMIGERRG